MKYLSKKIPYIALFPFLFVVFCYEFLPLVELAISSLTGKQSGSIGFENFIRIFTTPLYQKSIINSIYISLFSSIIGLIIAFLAAHFCHESSPKAQQRMAMILNMTSNFSGIPLAFAFMILMGNTGILTLLGKNFSIPFLDGFNLYGTDGLMIVYIYFQIPLATILLIPAFNGIKPQWKEAAIILNANSFNYWVKIIIPYMIPSLLGTLSVLFANALAAYATAYAIVMNNYALLALQITSKYKGDVQIDKATGGALAIILILLMVIATVINNYFMKRSVKGRSII